MGLTSQQPFEVSSKPTINQKMRK
jgi:hypothetical protein